MAVGHKLNSVQPKFLERTLDVLSFSCGAPLQELELSAELKEMVFVRNLQCHDPVEILYYSAKYESICIYCSQPTSDSKKFYPQCGQCKDKPNVSRK